MERLPRTGTAVSLGLRTPRKRVRVSLSCPVTLSTSVLSSRPFSRPSGDKSCQTEHSITQFPMRVSVGTQPSLALQASAWTGWCA